MVSRSSDGEGKRLAHPCHPRSRRRMYFPSSIKIRRGRLLRRFLAHRPSAGLRFSILVPSNTRPNCRPLTALENSSLRPPCDCAILQPHEDQTIARHFLGLFFRFPRGGHFRFCRQGRRHHKLTVTGERESDVTRRDGWRFRIGASSPVPRPAAATPRYAASAAGGDFAQHDIAVRILRHERVGQPLAIAPALAASQCSAKCRNRRARADV